MNALHYLKYFLFHGVGLISATAILAGGHYMSGGLLLILLIYIVGDAVCGNDTSTPGFKHPGILTAQLWMALPLLALIRQHPLTDGWHRAAVWHGRDTHAALLAHRAEHGDHPDIDRALRAGCLTLTTAACQRTGVH